MHLWFWNNKVKRETTTNESRSLDEWLNRMVALHKKYASNRWSNFSPLTNLHKRASTTKSKSVSSFCAYLINLKLNSFVNAKWIECATTQAGSSSILLVARASKAIQMTFRKWAKRAKFMCCGMWLNSRWSENKTFNIYFLLLCSLPVGGCANHFFDTFFNFMITMWRDGKKTEKSLV